MISGMQSITSREDLANNVRAEMARRRVDQSALAGALDLSRNAVSDRLRGRTRFSIEELQVIAAFLGVPLEQLLAPASEEVSA